MKKIRNLFWSLILCSFFSATAFAHSSGNISAVLNEDTLVSGNTMTISISSNTMTVSSFTCGMEFDPELVKVTAVTVSAINTAEGESWEPIIVSTPEQANQSGTVGFAYANAGDRTYAPGTIAEITFEAIGEGTAAFTLYEDSDGTNGNRADNVQVLTCQISDDSNTETEDPTDHKDEDRNHICDECGETIGECADEDGDNQCDICDKFLTLFGDVNSDGEVDVFDANLVVSYFYGSVDLTDGQLACADVNNDGEIDVFDANLIVSYFYGSIDVLPAE